MESPEKGLPLLLVDASVLPDVFSKVLEAKEYLQTGHAGMTGSMDTPAANYFTLPSDLPEISCACATI